jgi:proteasome accessory factor B
MRMFERDKDELRCFGIPIETVQVADGTVAYRLRGRDFYLPYLLLATSSGAPSRAKKVGRDGYKALPELTFEPDELEALTEAVARVQSLGDPLVASEAQSALRKLAMDLPIDAAAGDDVTLVPARPAADPAVISELDRALVRRKTVAFDYRSMSSDSTERRRVEPYGLFFLTAHWYLAGRDLGRGELRNFRVSRISGLEMNASRSQSADFDIPTGFVLREHARSKHAWELGDDCIVEAVVDFPGQHGATRAAARLGTPVRGHESRRSFTVRRVDVFARWLLSFGGEAVPLAPPAVVDAYRTLVDSTAAVYAGSPSTVS